MPSFQDRIRHVLERQNSVAQPGAQERFIKELEQCVKDRKAAIGASATKDQMTILGLINLAREADDLDEAVWRCFLATHFGEYVLCDSEATDSAFRLLCAFGDKPYWTWRRLLSNPYAFQSWLVERTNELRSLLYGNHRKFESKQPSAIWEVVESFLKMADDYGGPHGLITIQPPDEDVHRAFDLLFHRLKELSHFSVLGAFDFVVLLNDMKLVRAEPASCYLRGRRRDRGPLWGAIKLWGNLRVSELDKLAADLAKKLDISPVALESALCDWSK